MNVATLIRAGALCVVCGWLAACNSASVDSYQTLKLAVAGPPPLVTAGYVRALERPALLARLGQSEALLVMGSANGGFVEWQGLSQALVTHHGRLVQSAGLPDQADIIAPLATDDPFRGDLRALQDGLEITRQFDLPGRFLTGIPQHARYTTGPVQQRLIMGEQRMLQRIDEAVSVPALNFRTTNHYWIDPASGRVLISRQQLAPDLPVLELTELVQP